MPEKVRGGGEKTGPFGREKEGGRTGVKKGSTQFSNKKTGGLFQGVFRKKDSDTTKIKLDIAFVFYYMYNVLVIKNTVL